MKRFLIIDGSNLLFQMFFGMPARIVNKQGKSIQGTLGFVGALLKIIRKVEPAYVVALFDGQHENNRSDLDAKYKANRVDYSEVPEEENPFSQLNDVYAALDFIGIKHPDKVSVLRYRGKNTVVCTPEYIIEKFGITPEQYADFKSLTGDTSDNIKGADKIGPKTAASLLNVFCTLENILANAENIKRPSIKESIIRNTQKLKTNYKMIKLGNAVPLPFAPEELAYNYTGITTNEVLQGIGLK
ncbi:MAG: 5'-3' exonuclease H3TH domain-containing protein [Eubacteriales bacterium]|nr:5'-3' exonuclease H3TH domain-containing protein [Eubacteriales bacterium]